MAKDKGLIQVSDTNTIKAEIGAVLDENADKVAEYRAGKDKLFGFFVGLVMKKTKGKDARWRKVKNYDKRKRN